MKKSKISRAFASFDGVCPFKCLHCYTYTKDFNSKGQTNISNIIEKLEKETFDIIYISGYKENFYPSNEGIDLIESIYERFNCHILFTTRNVFSKEEIQRLSQINKNMNKSKKLLFACVSISAGNSYRKIEPKELIKSPEERVMFLKKLFDEGIITILTLRPVFPDGYIPTKEYLDIINLMENNCDAIISSGIVVNEHILQQLKDFPENYNYAQKPIMNCLQQDNLLVKYVDVSTELENIKGKSYECNIPFFSESMDAVEYFIEKYT